MKKILLMFFLITGFFYAVDAMERPGKNDKEYAARLSECKDILSRQLPNCSPLNDQDFSDRILLLTKKIEALNFLESKIPSEKKKPFAADFGIERDKWQEQIQGLKAEQEKRANKHRNVD